MDSYRVHGARQSRLSAILAALVLVGMLAASLVLAPAARAVNLGEGRYVPGFGAEDFSGRGFWLGAYAPPGNVDQAYPVWCTHMWRANPEPAHTASVATLTESQMWGPDDLDVTTPELAWLLNKYQGDANNGNARAALSYLIHANFEGEQPGKNTQESVNLMVSKVQELAPDIHALAAQFVAEARNSAVVGYESGSATGEGKREGVVQNIGTKNAAGGWIAGVPLTVRLSGPAVFKATGTATWTGTTQSQPVTLEWQSTANGEVSYVIETKTSRRTLTMYGVDGSVQDTLSYGNRPAHGDPETTRTQGPSWRVIFDFQPMLTSDVAEGKIVDGGKVSDTLTVFADPNYGDGQWIDETPVTFVGKAYYVGEELPVQGAVPADAQVVAEATLSVTGPGTHTVEADYSGEPGFVTWVWTMTKAEQSQPELVHEDWSDDYGLEAETLSQRFDVEIDTTISSRVTKRGTYLVDDMWIEGLPGNHPDFAGGAGFAADVKNVKQELLFFPDGVSVLDANVDQAELIAAVEVPAKNGFYPSVGDLKFKVKDDGSAGTYVFRTSFEGDDRVKPMQTSVEDKHEQFRVDGVVPTLGTTATDKADGDKIVAADTEVTVVDKACYTGLKPGKEYVLSGKLMDKASSKPLLIDGKPVEASKTFTAQSADGCETLDFTFNSSALGGKEIVVFEDVLHDGVLVVSHADINDGGQTVKVEDKPTPKGGNLARTGASAGLLAGGAAVAALAGVGLVALRRRKA